MSCIVADSGPLIALARLGLLHLPKALFGDARLTQTVFDECVAGGARADATAIVAAVNEGIFERCADVAPASALEGRLLDAGEASALALALSLKASVLLDELRGRRVAAELEIPVIGFCGLLLLAKREALLPAVMPLLQQACADGYFLSEALLAQLRRLADE